MLVEDVIVTNRTHANGRTYKTGAIHRYQYSNHLGSACLELDHEAAIISYEEYHPYGTSAYRAMTRNNEAPAKRYRYTGMERDEESGLSYHTARYYILDSIRWCSSDPSSIRGGGNLYLYADNNPIRLKDSGGDIPTAGEIASKWENSWLARANPVLPGFRGESFVRQSEQLMDKGLGYLLSLQPSDNSLSSTVSRNMAVVSATSLKTVGTVAANVIAGVLDPLSIVRGVMHLGEGAAAGYENIEKGNVALGASQIVGDVSAAVLVATPAIKTGVGVARLGTGIADAAGVGFEQGAAEVIRAASETPKVPFSATPTHYPMAKTSPFVAEPRQAPLPSPSPPTAISKAVSVSDEAIKSDVAQTLDQPLASSAPAPGTFAPEVVSRVSWFDKILGEPTNMWSKNVVERVTVKVGEKSYHYERATNPPVFLGEPVPNTNPWVSRKMRIVDEAGNSLNAPSSSDLVIADWLTENFN